VPLIVHWYYKEKFDANLYSVDCVLQELMTHVESFQCEAQKVIQSGATDVTRLQQLLDNGHTLDVDLPEIPKLKQVWTGFIKLLEFSQTELEKVSVLCMMQANQ